MGQEKVTQLLDGVEPYFLTEDGSIAVYLGDSTELVPKLQPKSVHFVFTDPPYGINFHDDDLATVAAVFDETGNRSREPRPIANDDPDDGLRLADFTFREAKRVLVRGGAIATCAPGGGGRRGFVLGEWHRICAQYLDAINVVVWDKGPIGLGWYYRRSWESIIVAKRRGEPMNWYDETDAIENVIRPGQYGIARIIPSPDEHPTEKPWQLAAHFLRLHTRPGDLVLDPFCGSGSTLLAAFYGRRRAIGIELDPRWAKRAADRLAEAQNRPRVPFEDRPRPSTHVPLFSAQPEPTSCRGEGVDEEEEAL